MDQVVGTQLTDILTHVLLAKRKLNASPTWDNRVDDGHGLVRCPPSPPKRIGAQHVPFELAADLLDRLTAQQWSRPELL